MGIETELTTIDGQPNEQEEVLLAKWDKENKTRKRISWKNTTTGDVVHLLIEHVSQEEYKILKRREYVAK